MGCNDQLCMYVIIKNNINEIIINYLLEDLDFGGDWVGFHFISYFLSGCYVVIYVVWLNKILFTDQYVGDRVMPNGIDF